MVTMASGAQDLPGEGWTSVEILAFASTATATIHRAYVPTCLESVSLQNYLALRFPELLYASLVIEPGVEAWHVWIDPASCSWTEMMHCGKRRSTMRGGGPRKRLYDEIVSAVDGWCRRHFYGQSAAGDPEPDVRT